MKKLVRKAMKGYDAKNTELRDELAKYYPNGAKLCDLFSGRAMIPLEAARIGVQSWALDYSLVATLAGSLLVDYPMRDFDDEPDLPFDGYGWHTAEHFTEPRLLRDVRFVLELLGSRYEAAMSEVYPGEGGDRHPWGYVWAVTLPSPCHERPVGLVGGVRLRQHRGERPSPRLASEWLARRRVADHPAVKADPDNTPKPATRPQKPASS